jgi:hypothetical protein
LSFEEAVPRLESPGGVDVTTVVVDVVVVVVVVTPVGVLGVGPAAWLTPLAGPVAGTEFSGAATLPPRDGGGVPAVGLGVPVGLGSVAVGVVEGVDESGGDEAGADAAGAELAVFDGGVLLGCDGGAGRDSLPGGLPDSFTGGRPPDPDVDGVGESVDVGSLGIVIGSLPGTVIVVDAVGSSLGLDGPPPVLGCAVSVGVHVGDSWRVGDSSVSPGCSIGAVATGAVEAEFTAVGSWQRPAPSPALAPLPGNTTARVTAAATQSAAANAPPIRLRRVIRPLILCVRFPGRLTRDRVCRAYNCPTSWPILRFARC